MSRTIPFSNCEQYLEDKHYNHFFGKDVCSLKRTWWCKAVEPGYQEDWNNKLHRSKQAVKVRPRLLLLNRGKQSFEVGPWKLILDRRQHLSNYTFCSLFFMTSFRLSSLNDVHLLLGWSLLGGLVILEVRGFFFNSSSECIPGLHYYFYWLHYLVSWCCNSIWQLRVHFTLIFKNAVDCLRNILYFSLWSLVQASELGNNLVEENASQNKYFGHHVI